MNCIYESPYGEIVSNWKIEANEFDWEVTIPPNCTATIYIPEKDIKVDGIDPSKMKDINFICQEINCSVFKIESGNYFFTCKR